MSFKNLFESPTLTSSRRRPTRCPPSARLSLEALEDRCLLSFGMSVDVGADQPAFGLSPEAMVAADFNGDGRLDLATAIRLKNTVSVVLGNGNGTFQAPRTSTCVDPAWIQAGDLNADGKADLVTWNNSDSIRVLLGNGDGTFQPPQAITAEPQISPGNTELGPLPQYLQAVALGDFNGDGKLDLVAGGMTVWTTVAGYNEDGSAYYDYHVDYYANVLLGNGDGTFLLTDVKSTPNPLSPDAGDFNNDGRLDLLTGWLGSSSGGVLPGNGDGTFGELVPSTATIVGFGGVSHPVGDFNGDGNLDVLWVDSSPYFGYSTTLVVFGNGDGTFRPGGYFEPVGDNSLFATAAGDVNADGKLDIVAIRDELDYADFTTTRSMRVLLGGSFAPIDFDLGTVPGLGWSTSAVLADFDGDGLPDLGTTDVDSGNDADPGVYRGPFVALNDGIWTPLPQISISDASVIEGQAGTVSAVFTVTLTGNPTGPVSVVFSTSGGSADATTDFDAQSGTLSFGPGVFSRTITVPVRGDRLAEGDEYFYVNLTNPANALIQDGLGEGSILDDEPRISINHVYSIDPLTVVEGDVGTTPAVFTVTLSRPYEQEVTVDYSTLTGHTSDIVAAAGTLHFLPGQTSKTITVQIVNDLIDEPLEAFNVILSNPTANATIAVNGGYCIIEDNDPSPPSISISDASVVEGNSGTKLMTYTVSLSQPAGQEVRVQFKTANGTAKAGSDYVAASGNVTIAAGQTSQTFTVAVVGDRSAEANETFFVNLSNPNYGVISDGQGVGTILDDEPRISISDVTKAEGKKGQTTLFTFTVTLSAAYDQAVTMSFRTVDGTAKTSDSDYVAKTGTLTFAPGETMKTITIEVKGDSKKEANETFYLDLFGNSSNALFTKNRGIGTILNDD